MDTNLQIFDWSMLRHIHELKIEISWISLAKYRFKLYNLKITALKAVTNYCSWQQARATYFSTGVNQKSLSDIEKAAFVVILDDGEHDVRDDDHAGISDLGRSLLHGKCHDRWEEDPVDRGRRFIVSSSATLFLRKNVFWSTWQLSMLLVQCIFITNTKYRYLANKRSLFKDTGSNHHPGYLSCARLVSA